MLFCRCGDDYDKNVDSTPKARAHATNKASHHLPLRNCESRDLYSQKWLHVKKLKNHIRMQRWIWVFQLTSDAGKLQLENYMIVILHLEKRISTNLGVQVNNWSTLAATIKADWGDGTNEQRDVGGMIPNLIYSLYDEFRELWRFWSWVDEVFTVTTESTE